VGVFLFLKLSEVFDMDKEKLIEIMEEVKRNESKNTSGEPDYRMPALFKGNSN
jgi:hypothetical protein